LAAFRELRTISHVDNKKDQEITLVNAALRALRVFLLIAVIGFAMLGAFVMSTEGAPVATVVQRDILPIPVQSPNRPSDYPDDLPTINNVSLIKLSPEPGIIMVHLATPDTPAKAVQSVLESFNDAGWDTTFATGDTLLAGSATLKDLLVGVTVFPDEYKSSPVGWTTILIYLEKEADKVDRVAPQPLPPSGPKG